ncbi:DUF7409 domain-containing protein [Halostella salina]|uniref:DUF7409 domain-containing protein n=1 Tax=Halostella salina TaxID=1547897 RepID=UPI0013CEF1E1|nr:helix-hairpin-helix domain-containing protein [Halostella salina]
MSQDETGDDADRTDLLYVGEATATVMAKAGIDAADVRRKTVSYRELVDAGVNPGVATKIRREHSLHWSLDEEGADLDDRSRTVRGLRDGERDWVAESGIDLDDGSADDESTADGDWTPSGGDGTVDGGPADDGRSSLTDGDWTPTGDVTEETADPAGDWTPSADDGGGAAEPAETDGSGGAEAAESAWRERSRPDPLTELPAIDEADAERLGDAGVTSIRRLATADPEHVADVLDMDEATVAEWHDAAADRIGK